MSDALTPRRHALPFRISRRVYRGAQILRTGHNTWAGLRILGYHRVSDDFDELAVTPAQFRMQMLTLRASGMSVVRLSDIETLASLPTGVQHVCVTFDDGYYDNLEHAVPVLAELGMPATIFLLRGSSMAKARSTGTEARRELSAGAMSTNCRTLASSISNPTP